jgi:RHS repeat-associated protein
MATPTSASRKRPSSRPTSPTATLTAPLHQTVRTWEANRDALKSIRSTTPGAGGTNFLTAAYGDANFAVNGIGQRTSADYSGEIYQSLYSSQENYTAAGAYTYGYNANGELVSQTGGKSHGYQYDPIGNRLEATAAGNTVATYQPNALNQYDAIITAGPTTVNPQHDPDGNLVNDGTKRYVWDAENRLIEVRQATGDALIASYRYDSMSRRIYKQTTALAPQGAGEAVFVYDGWNLVCEYSISNNQASVTRAYTWGLDLSGSLQGAGGVGGLLAIENKTFGSSLQGVYYPLYDGNGNVLATLEDSGSSTSVADAYHYDPFGKMLLSVGDSDNPFRFSTKYFDKETGFYYYGYRYYDPVTGRWPSRDPLGDLSFFESYTKDLNDAAVSHFYRESLKMPYLMIDNQIVNKYDIHGLAGPLVPAAAAVILLKALDLAAGCVCGLFITDLCALQWDVGYFFGSGGSDAGLFEGFTPTQIECIAGALTTATAPPGTGAAGSAVAVGLTVPVCGGAGFIAGAINYGR